MKLRLTALPQDHAICRLPEEAPFPSWADGSGCVSLTRGPSELSVVCPSDRVPAGVTCDMGWKALRVETLANLDAPGVVYAAIAPISGNGHGVFVISTFLRDWVLVRQNAFPEIAELLAKAGHRVTDTAKEA